MSDPLPKIDREAERRHMEDRLRFIDIRSVFAAARRMSSQAHRRDPNWVFAMGLLGVGSTYAHGFCLKHDIDPDSFIVPLRTKPVAETWEHIHPPTERVVADAIAGQPQEGEDDALR